MVALLLVTLIIAAADPAPAPSAPPVAAPKAKPEMVCHNEKRTGGHFVERVCVTREEAEKAQQAAQDTMTSLNRRPKAAEKPAN